MLAYLKVLEQIVVNCKIVRLAFSGGISFGNIGALTGTI